jgi:hypothetical protein
MANSRDSYNLKKIQQFNKIDQAQNKDNLVNQIIKPEKIEKPNLNLESMIKNRESDGKKELDECIKKRTNVPYKGIIKNFNYDRKFESSDDLVVHKVTPEDKKNFDSDVKNYNKKIQVQDKELNDVYSKDKKQEHKKEFEYQHKYKYRTKLEDNTTDSNLRTDRIEFYKKEQQKMEDSKKKIDDILINLIDSGVLSENLDSINFDKINIEELEQTLKKEFGEEEYSKLLSELK